MLVELAVSISPNGAALTLADLAGQLPGLHMAVAPELPRAPISFVGRIALDDSNQDSFKRAIAGQLSRLREMSVAYPQAVIAITPEDGGSLRLEAGSFGADDPEVQSLLNQLEREQTWRLLVSFRVDAEAHPRILELVERTIPAASGLVPVIDQSPNALALGYAITGGADQVADVISGVRMAWRAVGSEIEYLVEVEGERPALRVVRSWADWIDLERTLRQLSDQVPHAADPGAPPEGVTRLADVAEADEILGQLGHTMLSWIDDDDQILGILDGKLYALPERTEDGTPFTGEIRRRAGGLLHFVRGDLRYEVPPPASGTERRLHSVSASGAVFTDTSGNATTARTRLLLVSSDGVENGPELTRVRAFDVESTTPTRSPAAQPGLRCARSRSNAAGAAQTSGRGRTMRSPPISPC